MMINKRILAICSLWFCFMLIMCSCSNAGSTRNQTVKIAVLGDIESFYPAFQNGTETAIDELNEAYADLGYEFKIVFYDDDNDYEKGLQNADKAVKDGTVTAVIGSQNMEISRVAAKLCDNNEKLFISPYFLYDKVFTENGYTLAFSLSNSAENVGKVLRKGVNNTSARRLAVCCDKRTFEIEEMQGFVNGADDDICIVDSVDISELQNNFDKVYDRWVSLGIDGVVMFPEDNKGFELVKKLKNRNPDLIFAGDTAFDNSKILLADKELLNAMNNFIIVDEFNLFGTASEEEWQLYAQISNDYENKYGEVLDSWYFQGYNAVKMIGDTAVKVSSSEPKEIGALLHREGYKGIIQNFEFDKNGLLQNNLKYYGVYSEEGYIRSYNIE